MNVEELIARSFCARDCAHIAHWQTKSFAEHEAFGAFYEGIIDLLDKFVEAYQGAFGIIGEIKYKEKDSKSAMNYLKGELAWLAKNREKIAKDVSPLENIIDEILALYMTTLYKLENLK